MRLSIICEDAQDEFAKALVAKLPRRSGVAYKIKNAEKRKDDYICGVRLIFDPAINKKLYEESDLDIEVRYNTISKAMNYNVEAYFGEDGWSELRPLYDSIEALYSRISEWIEEIFEAADWNEGSNMSAKIKSPTYDGYTNKGGGTLFLLYKNELLVFGADEPIPEMFDEAKLYERPKNVHIYVEDSIRHLTPKQLAIAYNRDLLRVKFETMRYLDSDIQCMMFSRKVGAQEYEHISDSQSGWSRTELIEANEPALMIYMDDEEVVKSMNEIFDEPEEDDEYGFGGDWWKT